MCLALQRRTAAEHSHYTLHVSEKCWLLCHVSVAMAREPRANSRLRSTSETEQHAHHQFITDQDHAQERST